MDKSDKFPKYLCQECTQELLISAKFRTKCAASDELLRQRYIASDEEDAAAALALSELAGEEIVVDDNIVEEEDEDKIIEYDPTEHVELYEECETQSTEHQTLPIAKKTIGSISTNVSNFNCDDCGAIFQQAVTLQQHISKAHAALETYDCERCGHRFTQSINLDTHSCAESDVLAAEVRAKAARYRCIHCGKCLQSHSSLVIHMRVHNGERPFACDACPKTFKTNAALITHQKRHLKLMEFKCEHCGKDFVESSNLRRHIASLHSTERPHTCTICQRSFARVYLLELHKRTHTGERPYACSHCNNSFAQLSVLRSHERIHTGERRHRCTLCQKTFSRVIQLKNHARKPCRSLDSGSAARTAVEELS